MFSQAAGIEIVVHCDGDRHIDDHHTAEVHNDPPLQQPVRVREFLKNSLLFIAYHHTAQDVAITLGQCLHEALGEKKGCQRMGCAEGASGAATVRAVLDLL